VPSLHFDCCKTNLPGGAAEARAAWLVFYVLEQLHSIVHAHDAQLHVGLHPQLLSSQLLVPGAQMHPSQQGSFSICCSAIVPPFAGRTCSSINADAPEQKVLHFGATPIEFPTRLLAPVDLPPYEQRLIRPNVAAVPIRNPPNR
jgi:hypothetical protein